MAMLWQAVALTLLLLPQGPQGQDCSDSTEHVVGLSGLPLCLQPPNTQTKAQDVKWRMQLPSLGNTSRVLGWKNNQGVKYASKALEHFNNTLDIKNENLTLFIKVAKPQYSGLYRLEMTDEYGNVYCIQFKVLVFDHIEKPRLQVEQKTLEEGKCLVILSCLVSRSADVSYAWYRGNKLISTQRNLSQLEVQVDANEVGIYTCTVSNPASRESQTLSLTPGCLSECSTLGCSGGWRHRAPQPGSHTGETGFIKPGMS